MRTNKKPDGPTDALPGDGRPRPSFWPEDGLPSPDGQPEGAAAREEEARPLRGRNDPSIRRRLAQRGKPRRWLAYGTVVVVLVFLGALGWEMWNYLLHGRRFLLASPSAIQLQGDQMAPRSAVVRIFAGDLGHSVFAVPLQVRRAELEALPWVRHATVMRLWPDRLRVVLQERVPVAYLRDGNQVRMVDAEGVLFDMPQGAMQHASFPVVTGAVSGGPASTRKAGMQSYLQFMAALEAGGPQVTQTVSEVDISDPEDTRAVIADGPSEILVHFGDSDFLARYQSFAAHRAEWMRLCPQLASVDMRGGRQVVLSAGQGGTCGPGASAATANAPEAGGDAALLKARNGPMGEDAKPSAGKRALANGNRKDKH
ncbi:MAG: cell division protein FtsQ/DivIB [Acidobacteriaceae bacterium]